MFCNTRKRKETTWLGTDSTEYAQISEFNLVVFVTHFTK